MSARKLKIDHGLTDQIVEVVTAFGFKPKRMSFSNNKEKKPYGGYDIFLDEVDGMVKHIKNHMGGNYGKADQYIVVNKDGVFNMQYFGDGSATLKEISKDDQLAYMKL
jgi:hypothetical protein